MHTVSPSRCGSMLFLLIVLLSVLTLIAYAFVRSIQVNTAASKADSIYLLTQGAAQAGLDHATAAILADYAKTSVKLRKDGGDITVNNPPTVLEGAWRQPFTSLFRPNTLRRHGVVAENDDLRAWDDVRAEDLLDAPFETFWGGGWDYSNGQSFSTGYTYHDGRGRFYEPGFYNRPWIGTESDPLPNLPTVPLRFTDADPDVPNYSKGLWLDENLRPINESDPIVARRLARYRLRYAVGVDDLDGKLLANGDVWLEHPNVTDTDPASAKLAISGDSGNEPKDYRVRRLVRWSPVYFNLMQTVVGTVGALRAEHVFLNRGSTANYAKAADGFPVSWPLMWREVQTGNGSAAQWSVFGFNPSNSYPTKLYQYADGTGAMITAPSLAGGNPLAKDAKTPAILTLGGPQYSFDNLWLANLNVNEAPGANGYKPIYHRMFTPFGRGMSANAETATGTYKDDVDCPWRVNVMTAPRVVISAMLNAYIPWRTRTGLYTKVVYDPTIKTQKSGAPFPETNQLEIIVSNPRAEQARDCFISTFNSSFAYEGPKKVGSSDDDKDLKPNWMTPDFKPVIGPVIGPVFWRNAKERYPGPLMDTETLATALSLNQGPDDCGKDVGTMSTSNPKWDTAGYCIYSQGGFFNTPGKVQFGPPTNPGTTEPPNWNVQLESNEIDSNGNNVKYYVWRWAMLEPATEKFAFKDSYFFDMTWAMAQAISIMRMQWSQYDNGYGTWKPTTNANFSPPSLWKPDDYQTMADLDRLFLQNLGIDITKPSDEFVTEGWEITWYGVNTWVIERKDIAKFNIRKLRKEDKLASAPAGNYDSLNRSRVMELVLNDYRMSFFGSNPDYRAQFRPLDFNGDGVVHCSCFDSEDTANLTRPTLADNPAEGALPAFLSATVAKDLRLDEWETVADADKPIENDRAFSISGNFFIGKSRYYRVVTRGELWDNLIQRPVSGLTMDSVLAVDPQVKGAGGLNATSILYQRYHWNKYRGAMARTGE